MKKIILVVLLALAFTYGYSQEQGKFRVGLDLGFVPSGGGGGVMFSLEPKFNINDNMNIGLRFGIAAIVKDINTDANSPSAKVSASGSYVGTYDYYFHKSGSSFAPYVGGGLGYYSLANVEVDENTGGDSTTEYSPAVSGAFGGLIRGGFEWAGFRMGLEYNFIPDSDLEDINGVKKGTAKNAYLGIHIGFFVGGGKWGK
ncbi:outer membrane beta-barrel protein [Flavobacterium franklandianum]|uniref:Outer membrane beta-barrel protein n=1 Tax=Flavobacterium franklandianum TaxID=2594430 RepID=A0A553C7Z5_9FLAO|nr:outer membrane beta-barrel protein [Flavobacterium franklandianum]TRX16638.1 outer membrane beta-barrel protein [Flavobacterium franklandianum]TRX22351.1 outer membrane beta-barrel protein [Flavobacterium franklandianum]